MLRALLLSPLLLLQCSRSGTPQTGEAGMVADGHNSRNALDWAGTYRDTLPAADGPGILTTLTLNDDQTYTLTTQFLEENDPGRTVSGDFDWRPDGGTIQLLGLDAEQTPAYFQVAEGRVYQLDLEGKRIQGPLAENYALPKLEPTLTDTRWQLRQLRGGDVSIEGGEIPTLVLRTKADLATGTGGCNTFRSAYELAGDRLTFAPAAATKRACPALATETAYFQALGEVRSYRIEGADLLLLDEAGEVLLRLR